MEGDRWRVTGRERQVEGGRWREAGGGWQVERGRWREAGGEAGGERPVESGSWRGRWREAGGERQVKGGSRMVTVMWRWRIGGHQLAVICPGSEVVWSSAGGVPCAAVAT